MKLHPTIMRFFAIRFTNRARGVKVYRTAFDGPGGYAKVSRKNHKTKSAAEQYGFDVLARWRKLLTEEVTK